MHLATTGVSVLPVTHTLSASAACAEHNISVFKMTTQHQFHRLCPQSMKHYSGVEDNAFPPLLHFQTVPHPLFSAPCYTLLRTIPSPRPALPVSRPHSISLSLTLGRTNGCLPCRNQPGHNDISPQACNHSDASQPRNAALLPLAVILPCVSPSLLPLL